MFKEDLLVAVFFALLLLAAGLMVVVHGEEAQQVEITATAPEKDAPETTDEKEIYSGTAEGFGGDLTVEVIIGEGDIQEIKIIEHSETEGLAEPALEGIPEAIIASQSLDVDLVSGATETSEAIIHAVKQALDTADWFSEDAAGQVFSGRAEGYGGDLKVEVSLAISDIKVVEHSETEGLAEPALEGIPEAIIASQSLDVDLVSGATETSEAIIHAVKQALDTADWSE